MNRFDRLSGTRGGEAGDTAAGGRRTLDFAGLSPAALAFAWIGLVAIGVVGRLFQPAYNVSPLVALGVCAGALFPSPVIAATVPALALAASNLALPGGGQYGSWVMAGVIYAAFMWPVLIGPLVRRHRAYAAMGGALAGSLVFFLSTNFVHWCFGVDYPRTLSGLGECYVAALPFYRWMPVGDLAWTAGLLVALTRLEAIAADRRGVREIA